MVPWPGRIDGGRFVFEGRQYHVPSDTPRAHALHGRAVYQAWRIDEIADARCRLSVEFDNGWPFGGAAGQEIIVRDHAIEMRLEVRSTRGHRFPAGSGWHPWFRRDVVRGKDARVLIDADHVYEADDMIPTGWLKPVIGDTDLRSFPTIGNRRLDVCYRGPRSIAIAWGDLTLRMRSSPNVGHAVVHTPERAICIEPQTCAPDACNLHAQGIDGCGMTVVTPRRPLIATTTWSWSTT